MAAVQADREPPDGSQAEVTRIDSAHHPLEHSIGRVAAQRASLELRGMFEYSAFDTGEHSRFSAMTDALPDAAPESGDSAQARIRLHDTSGAGHQDNALHQRLERLKGLAMLDARSTAPEAEATLMRSPEDKSVKSTPDRRSLLVSDFGCLAAPVDPNAGIELQLPALRNPAERPSVPGTDSENPVAIVSWSHSAGHSGTIAGG